MRLTLTRHESGDQGTFGRIVFGDRALFTGELPERGNTANRSRIPAGTYVAVWCFSPRWGRYLYLLGMVPGRSGIRIHPANLMGDVQKGYRSQLNGCIALGERLGWIDGQKALLLSAPAVRTLHEYTQGRSFELEIIDGDI